MRISVDLTRCQGYANCVGAAPELFDLDDDTGLAVVKAADPPDELHDAARKAVANCPVQAISVEEGA